MSDRPARPIAGGMIAGLILIVLGVVFALDSMGIVYAGDLLSWWPLILIGLGLARILQTRIREQRIGYVILIVIGAFFLLRNLHVPWLRGRDLLPVVLLAIGILLVWQALTRRRIASDASPASAERVLEGAREGLGAARQSPDARREVGSVLHEFAFMGGGDRIVRSRDFRGGEVTAIMGGFHIDLRGAGMAGDSATIEIFTLWGGVDLRVPEDWNVLVRGTPILGVFTTTGRPVSAAAPAKTLILKGAAIMGGVEVKY